MNLVELEEHISRRGELILMDGAVIDAGNEKYIERHILKCDNKFYLIYHIFDQYIDEICYFFDIEEFNLLYRAQKRYNELYIPYLL